MRLTLTFCLLVSFTTVSGFFSVPTVIDETNVGHLGFAGSYAGISNVNSIQQFQSSNEDSIILRNNNSTFDKISDFQGNITSSCMFQNSVYFGGHFETVNQTYLVHHIVKFDTQTNQFQSLNEGLNGPVYSLYCDDMDQMLYVGGNFSSPIDTNSTMSNVASWNFRNGSWSLLPWKGFNGPVYTITKNTKYNTILFGGHFDATGDGQFFNSNTSQLVPLSSPTTISSGNGAYQADPKSIICPAQISNAQPWYLQDGVPGYWDANFANPVEPTVFRLSNTHAEKGTILFNILALGWNEYFNLSYVDPVTQQTTVCSEDCTLSNATYQDFTVINSISTTGIRININSWYGSGGGLGYVQIYQSDISVNPHLNTNNSQCSPTASSTQTKITGNWKDVYVFGYYQTILAADLLYSELATTDTAIVYEPNIPAQGQYDVYATTPGCVGSSNCFTRTQVEYLLELSPGFPVTTVISDQNTFTDNRILLYSGYISPVSLDFRPSITLRPAPNATKPLNNGLYVQIMADTIEFVRNVTAAPLVSILEYNPASATNTTAISWKPLNQQLPMGSTVYSIDASDGDILYIGGDFASANTTGFKNIISYDNQLGQLLPLNNDSAGLNGRVSKVISSNSILYVGGEFNATTTNFNLNHVGIFDTVEKTWSQLGNGVDGSVNNLLLSSDNSTLTVSGAFNHRMTHNDTIISVGNAQWDIKAMSWTERSSLLVGQVAADNNNLLAGAILGAQTYRADLVLSSNLNSSKIIFNGSVVVSAGVTWLNNQTHEASTIIAQYNEETNQTTAVLIRNNVTNTWNTIDIFQGQVYSLATFGNWLYVGGQFSSARQGNQSVSFAIYDLVNNYSNVRVQGVTDDSNNPGIINVIKSHPDGKKVLIGGKFTRVGLLECEAVCALDPSTLQWDPVALSLKGTAYDLIVFVNENSKVIIAVGDLSVQNQPSTAIASVSDSADSWSTFSGSDQLSGIPVTVVSGTNNDIIMAGTSASNNVFVGSLNGNTYTSLESNLEQGTNISQLLLVPVSSSSEQRYPSGTQNLLLAVGTLNIKDFGNASAALYDGTAWYPYLVTTKLDGQPGNIQRVIHATDFNAILNGRHYLSIAAVILISIAISIGILFALSAAALLFLYKQHKDARGPDEMPPWAPTNNRLMDAFGLFGTGSLGAATIAATSAGAGVAEASTTGRAAAGPSNATSRSAFQHDEGDIGLYSPTNTIINPIPITTAAAAAGILSFESMVASAKANSAAFIDETHPKLFYAKYAFKAQEYGELSLDAGDTIVVTDTTDNVWWLGYKDGGLNKPLSGVFPSNYVKP